MAPFCTLKCPGRSGIAAGMYGVALHDHKYLNCKLSNVNKVYINLKFNPHSKRTFNKKLIFTFYGSIWYFEMSGKMRDRSCDSLGRDAIPLISLIAVVII